MAVWPMLHISMCAYVGHRCLLYTVNTWMFGCFCVYVLILSLCMCLQVDCLPFTARCSAAVRHDTEPGGCGGSRGHAGGQAQRLKLPLSKRHSQCCKRPLPVGNDPFRLLGSGPQSLVVVDCLPGWPRMSGTLPWRL